MAGNRASSVLFAAQTMREKGGGAKRAASKLEYLRTHSVRARVVGRIQSSLQCTTRADLLSCHLLVLYALRRYGGVLWAGVVDHGY